MSNRHGLHATILMLAKYGLHHQRAYILGPLQLNPISLEYILTTDNQQYTSSSAYILGPLQLSPMSLEYI